MHGPDPDCASPTFDSVWFEIGIVLVKVVDVRAVRAEWRVLTAQVVSQLN